MQRLRFILPLLFVCVCPTLHSQHTYPKDTIDGQVYYLYTVERSIGLYRISKNFDVSQESILQANPHLQHQGLSYGETIRIPIGTAIDDRQNIDTLAFTTTKVSSDSTIRLAIMLPLHADAIKRSKTMDRFYDFYTGALIAINEVQKQGQKLEVFIYDVGKTAQKTTQILRDSTWQKVDAIIGPAYTGQVSVASTYAQQDSTWLLVPFLPNVNEIDENPFLLKFNPSAEAEVDTLVNYLALHASSGKTCRFHTQFDKGPETP